MANTRQAKKRARQNVTRNTRNSSHRSAFRTAIKRVVAAIETADHETAQSEYQKAVKVIDKMTTRGLIHRNKAARHKSRLNAKIKGLAA